MVAKYGKDDKLYPSNIKARSVVDHRLHFDTGVLFQAVRYVSVSTRRLLTPVLFSISYSTLTNELFARFYLLKQKGILWTKTITSITPEIVNLFDDAYEMLEKFLNSGQFIAGNQVTIADFSVITTLANMMVSTYMSFKLY